MLALTGTLEIKKCQQSSTIGFFGALYMKHAAEWVCALGPKRARRVLSTLTAAVSASFGVRNLFRDRPRSLKARRHESTAPGRHSWGFVQFLWCKWPAIELLSCLALSPAAYAAPLADNKTPLERFKDLLSNPPIIERLVYAETLPKIPDKAPPLDTGIAGSTNQVLYELCWQPNALFMRQIRGWDDLANHAISGACYLRWDNRFYFLSAGGNPMVYIMEPDNVRYGHYPAPYHAALIRESHAYEPLNLGINHVRPGTVRWEGDHFTALGTADQKPMHVRGAINGLSNGIPCELTVQYSNDMGVANYRVAYQYGPYGPPYYPHDITLYFRYQGREIPYVAYAFLALTTATQALPETRFDPHPYLLASGRPLYYLTNNSLFYRMPSGKLIESPSAIPKLKLAPADYRQNRAYYASATLLSLGFFVLMLKEHASSKFLHPKGMI